MRWVCVCVGIWVCVGMCVCEGCVRSMWTLTFYTEHRTIHHSLRCTSSASSLSFISSRFFVVVTNSPALRIEVGMDATLDWKITHAHLSHLRMEAELRMRGKLGNNPRQFEHSENGRSYPIQPAPECPKVPEL